MAKAAALRLITTTCIAAVAAWAVAVGADADLVAPSPTAFITDRDGGFITQTSHQSRRADGGRQVEYGYWPAAPPPLVVAATLALEDRRFWSHPGVDPAALLRAVWQHVRGGHASGASTIAMQVARMQHPRPRTLWAKAVEAGTALVITARFGRDAVLAHYLRLAPYGDSSHGIAHAAQWYFERPASDLDPAQAALLSAIPQAPGLMALHRGLARAAPRARAALAEMKLSPASRRQAEAELATLTPVPRPRTPPPLQLALRLQRASQDSGGVIRSSIDPAMQQWVRRAAIANLDWWRPEGAQQVAVMVADRQGHVLADIGSAGFATRPGGAIDFTTTSRSPGSTLKPFLYALGLERRLIAPQDVMADLPDEAAGIGNSDHDFLGPLLPRQALANSRNVPAATLLRSIGVDDGFAFLRTIGLNGSGSTARRFGLAMAIGALPTSLERLMHGYATLANDGIDTPLRWWRDAATAGPGPRLISLDSARLVGRFISDPLARLPSFPRYGSSEFPFAVALKTGTSQGYRDAWTLAWSHDWLIGVWIGRADAGPMTQVSGARAAAQLAQTVLLRLHRRGRTDLVAGDLPAPPGRVQAELCTGTGAAADPGCGERLAEWVRPGHLAVPVNPSTQLSIVSPSPDTHVWRNPESPPMANRLVLRATTQPPVPQIVWLLDGQPVATAPPDQPLVWTMTPGHHRFQIRLPLQEDASRPIAVIVE